MHMLNSCLEIFKLNLKKKFNLAIVLLVVGVICGRLVTVKFKVQKRVIQSHRDVSDQVWWLVTFGQMFFFFLKIQFTAIFSR